MAKWVIEQKAEVWYRTEVEAETFEDAVEASYSATDWVLNENETILTDDFWGKNAETGDEFNNKIGAVN